jgi:protein ImuA
MAQSAVARERLFALRETIAKLEGKPAPTLAAAESQALAEADLLNGKTENALRLPLGIAALDDAMEGGVPLDGLTEIRTQLLRNAGASSGFVLALSAMLQRQDEESQRASADTLDLRHGCLDGSGATLCRRPAGISA